MKNCAKYEQPMDEQAAACASCGAATAASEPTYKAPPETAAYAEKAKKTANAAATALKENAKEIRPTILQFFRTPVAAVREANEKTLFTPSFFLCAAEIVLGGLAMLLLLFEMRAYLDSALGELLWMFSGSGMGSGITIPIFTTWLLGAAATAVGMALRIGFLAAAARVSGSTPTLRETVTASNLVSMLPMLACAIASVLGFWGMWPLAAGVLLWVIAGWVGTVIALSGLGVVPRDDFKRWASLLLIAVAAVVLTVLTHGWVVKLVMKSIMGA